MAERGGSEFLHAKYPDLQKLDQLKKLEQSKNLGV